MRSISCAQCRAKTRPRKARRGTAGKAKGRLLEAADSSVPRLVQVHAEGQLEELGELFVEHLAVQRVQLRAQAAHALAMGGVLLVDQALEFGIGDDAVEARLLAAAQAGDAFRMAE